MRPRRFWAVALLATLSVAFGVGLHVFLPGNRAGRHVPLTKNADPMAMALPIAPFENARSSSAKTLANLQQAYDESAAVIYARQAYDEGGKRLLLSIVEVWKGAWLVGDGDDAPLEYPMSFRPCGTQDTVLVFMSKMKAREVSRMVFFSGGELQIDPSLTVSSLKQAFVKPETATVMRSLASPGTRPLPRDAFSRAAKDLGIARFEASDSFGPTGGPRSAQSPVGFATAPLKLEEVPSFSARSSRSSTVDQAASLNASAQAVLADRLLGIMDGSIKVMPSAAQIRRMEAMKQKQSAPSSER